MKWKENGGEGGKSPLIIGQNWLKESKKISILQARFEKKKNTLENPILQKLVITP